MPASSCYLEAALPLSGVGASQLDCGGGAPVFTSDGVFLPAKGLTQEQLGLLALEEAFFGPAGGLPRRRDCSSRQRGGRPRQPHGPRPTTRPPAFKLLAGPPVPRQTASNAEAADSLVAKFFRMPHSGRRSDRTKRRAT
ncbi:hypothetical protein WJX81_004925 [Elliptochloris bilobata]|uniref:Uncharacterized protein n=1 Tax=Elliptochloris bilobata TaxID=381761 RepID=A0AAW1RLV0_9CHLO